MFYPGIFALIILLLVLYMRIETTLVEVKRVNLANPNKSRSGKTGLKIIQLSDVHVYLLRVSHKKIQSLIDREDPDAIIITGDCIEKESHIPAFIDLMRPISAKHRVFLCPGNHDYTAFKPGKNGFAAFIRQLNDLGVTVLINESVSIESKKGGYNLIGIDDLRCGRPDINKALSSLRTDAKANIAFAHNPDTVFLFKPGQVDYLLSGHFHGGQIWTPFKLEFKTLRADRLCRMGITRGMHNVNGINLYLNRGLGNVVLPLRFLSRPEITVFYLP